MTPVEQIEAIQANVCRVIRGKDDVVRVLLAGAACRRTCSH